MSERCVKINGVVLTETQIREAVKELDKPKYIPRPGQFFTVSDDDDATTYLCVDGSRVTHVAAGNPYPVALVTLDGSIGRHPLTTTFYLSTREAFIGGLK